MSFRDVQPVSLGQVPRLAMGLVHYPCLDKEKKVVATNITNFDIHDIARASTVYGLEAYFIVHPMKEQLMFVDRVLDHWRLGKGAQFNPYRKRSLERTRPVSSVQEIKQVWGDCKVIVTHARPVEGVPSYTCPEFKKILFQNPEEKYLLLFGTGYGLTEELMKSADGILESIRGAPPADFRHLSVRSAVSIYLDRLMGPW